MRATPRTSPFFIREAAMRWAGSGFEKCKVQRAMARRVVGVLWEGEVVGAASVVEGLGGVGGGMETM